MNAHAARTKYLSPAITLLAGLALLACNSAKTSADASKTAGEAAQQIDATTSVDANLPLAPTSVWLIGDSTVSPNSGWGDLFQETLLEEATVFNRARSGRSTKSFYEEDQSYWSDHVDAVLNHLQSGEYVLIQFAHNDEKDDIERHTDPGTAPDYQGTFRDFLELYIAETRAVGATPILITPVSRMVFDGDGTHRRTHGDYPAAMIKTAEDNDVVLLDLELRSHEIFEALGQVETMAQYSDGEDRTHFPQDKAGRVAKMVADLLREAPSPLARYVAHPE